MNKMKPAYWLPIGIAIGTSMGVALHNMAVGIAISVAVGLVFMAASARRNKL